MVDSFILVLYFSHLFLFLSSLHLLPLLRVFVFALVLLKLLVILFECLSLSRIDTICALDLLISLSLSLFLSLFLSLVFLPMPLIDYDEKAFESPAGHCAHFDKFEK